MGAITAEPGRVLAVGLLGPLQVSVAGRPVELPAGRLRPLLAVLALSAGQTVSVDRLAIAVWGEDPPGDARANVQTNVKRLRRVLGAALVTTHGSGYALAVGPDQVDALRFERLLDEAAAAGDPSARRDRLADALGLWRGTPFDGVRSEWPEQTQLPWLQERYLAALEQRIDLDIAEGSLTGLTAELGELTTRFPLREPLWVRLLLALERSGRPAEALERYEAVRARLAEELGADPGPELRQVHADLLAGRPPVSGVPGGMPSGRPPVSGLPVVPRQLPAGIEEFTGREAELKLLDALLDRQQPRVVITGPAGIGKTTLAIHWAHRVAGRFPDGQLYVNLRGFDPSGSPMPPGEALRGWLEALRVPPQHLPAGLDAQAGLYRSLLAGKRLLVLLDNAHHAEQVVPLLPGAPACLVLVTSRQQLPGLLATHAAHPVALGLLDGDEAAALLAGRLGHDRISAEPGATGELVTRCAGLPLALAIVAARAATHPTHPLAAFAGQLRAARGALGEFAAGDPATDIRGVFSWSYQRLSGPAARLFRLLGLHPGPEATAGAAASLAGLPGTQIRPLLAELAAAHLSEEPVPGRYAMHDLLRAYAMELAGTGDTGAERRAATHRLLDYYLHTAYTAALLLDRYSGTKRSASHQPRRGWHLTRSPHATRRRRGWPPSAACCSQPSSWPPGTGFHRHTCQLASALFIFLHQRGRWHDRAVVQQTALDAARRLGDPGEQVRAHRRLAVALRDLGRYDDAQRHLHHALDLSGELGDLVGLAWTHYHRNLVSGLQGRSAEALDAAQRALRLFQAAGDRVGQAAALTDVGWYHGRLGDHRQAVLLLRQALTLHQELDNRAYLAHTWSCLGDTYQQLGEPSQAIACYQRALDLFGEVGDRYAEASTLAHPASFARYGVAMVASSAAGLVVDLTDDTGHAKSGHHASGQRSRRGCPTVRP